VLVADERTALDRSRSFIGLTDDDDDDDNVDRLDNSDNDIG